ncbi:ArsR/SmtB family transcription factor [Pseudactinotalea sp. Z1748]|uniref:ArsR/SmtB family transcription factor n=1 Tax=Pseudactinotalea sp. Z1748 TaxID=3413027 RepID=UPI003C7D381D
MGFAVRDQPLYEIKADLFKGLAHPFRIRILELLSADPEVSVAQMLIDMDLEASHLSQHLSVLRRHRLVTSQRRGSHVYYRLASARAAELLTVARLLLADVLQTNAAQLEQATAPASQPQAPPRKPAGTAQVWPTDAVEAE